MRESACCLACGVPTLLKEVIEQRAHRHSTHVGLFLLLLQFQNHRLPSRSAECNFRFSGNAILPRDSLILYHKTFRMQPQNTSAHRARTLLRGGSGRGGRIRRAGAPAGDPRATLRSPAPAPWRDGAVADAVQSFEPAYLRHFASAQLLTRVISPQRSFLLGSSRRSAVSYPCHFDRSPGGPGWAANGVYLKGVARILHFTALR